MPMPLSELWRRIWPREKGNSVSELISGSSFSLHRSIRAGTLISPKQDDLLGCRLRIDSTLQRPDSTDTFLARILRNVGRPLIMRSISLILIDSFWCRYRKVPTCILYAQSSPEEEAQVIAWGLEAKNANPGPGIVKCVTSPRGISSD